MDVREFPLLPINNLKYDDTIEKMQLEMGASENTLDQIM